MCKRNNDVKFILFLLHLHLPFIGIEAICCWLQKIRKKHVAKKVERKKKGRQKMQDLPAFVKIPVTQDYYFRLLVDLEVFIRIIACKLFLQIDRFEHLKYFSH